MSAVDAQHVMLYVPKAQSVCSQMRRAFCTL